MKIINLTPTPSGAYSNIQDGNFRACPQGCAIVPETLDTSAFYQCGGFVTLTVEGGVVTGMAGDTAAWEAWQTAHPPVEPEPSVEDDIIEMTLQNTAELAIIKATLGMGGE